MGSHGVRQRSTTTTTTTTATANGENHSSASVTTTPTSTSTTTITTMPATEVNGKSNNDDHISSSFFQNDDEIQYSGNHDEITSTTTINTVTGNPPSDSMATRFRMQITNNQSSNIDSNNTMSVMASNESSSRQRIDEITETAWIIEEEGHMRTADEITDTASRRTNDGTFPTTTQRNLLIPSSDMSVGGGSSSSMTRTTSADSTSVVRDWTHLDMHVKTLDLSSHSIRTEHIYGLVQTLLDRCVELESIDLSSNHLGTKGMEKLQILLATHPTLKEVRLARNALKGRRALRYLWEGCHRNDRLRLLDLSHNQLSDTVVSKDLATLLDSRQVACRLETLDLSNNGARLTETSAWELGGALVSGHNTTLKTLKLSGNALGPAGGDALGTLLKLSHTLEALHVANCNLGDTGVQYICQGLLMAESEPALRILDVAWNVLHDDAASALSDVMENNSTLERVQLECNGIGDKGAAFLAHALPRSESLQVLDLRGNQIHDAGAIALAVALTNTRCQELELHWEMNAHMTHVGRHRIEGALQLRVSRRQWLNALLQNLQGVRRYPPLNYEVGDDEVVEICKHVATQQLQHAVTLPVVRFRGSGITLRGVKAVANQLLCPASVTLTHLYFMHTHMGDDGANLLAQALLRNQSLTNLTCIDCQWTDEGALYLSRALPRHRHLQRLDLRDNRVGTEGARAVLHAITEEAPNLHTLYLGKNQIGDMAVRSLTTIGHLLTLNLADNVLTDAAALDLARICGNISTPGSINGHIHEIKWLNVSRNYLTERGKQALDLFLPRLSTLDTSDQLLNLPVGIQL